MTDISALLPLLPAWRQREALAFRKEERQRECVLSFALLMWALRKDYGISEEIEFRYTEHGKPLLCHHPNIFFNMSHCREAVAVIAGGTPVGIDVERRGRYKASLAQEVLSPEELSVVNSSQNRDLAFTRLWTRKEAVVKLTGQGVGIRMRNVISDHPEITLRTFDRASYVCSVAAIS